RVGRCTVRLRLQPDARAAARRRRADHLGPRYGRRPRDAADRHRNALLRLHGGRGLELRRRAPVSTAAATAPATSPWGKRLGAIAVLGALLAALRFLPIEHWLLDFVAWVRDAGARGIAAFDRAIGREGLKIVLLVRLSPIFPFTLLNYALGLTRVAVRDYVVGSLIGMLPGTLMYVYLGSLVTSLTELAAGRPSGGALQK